MSDKKNIFYRFFNIPTVFNFVRNVLDGGQVDHIRSILNERGFNTILDVGCGTGRHILRLIDEKLDMIGLDISEIMLSETAVKIRETVNKRSARVVHGPSFIQCDGERARGAASFLDEKMINARVKS